MCKQQRKALEDELEIARLYMQHYANICEYWIAETWLERVRLLESMLNVETSEKEQS